MDQLQDQLKKVAKQGLYWTRRVQADKCALPDFIGIGAMKAGSSALYTYIVQHPYAAAALRKEVHFFDSNFDKGEKWYRAHFPLYNPKISRKTGEVSPFYMCNPHVPQRIADLLPNVKLIVVLRDPVERTISHYFHTLSKGREVYSIQEALQLEEVRISQELECIQREPSYHSDTYQYYAYKHRSIYVDQLRRYYSIFPSNQILVVDSKKLFTDPASTLKKVFQFLDLDPTYSPPDLRPKNVGQSVTTIPPAIYQELAEYFMPHNQALYELLDRNFEWRTPN